MTTAEMNTLGIYSKQGHFTGRTVGVSPLLGSKAGHTILLNILCTVLAWLLLTSYSNSQSGSCSTHTERSQDTDSAENVVPLVVSTWGVGEFVGAGRIGLQAMRDNKHRLDVVQAMCRYCEEKQCDGSVGYGSHPDTDGHVTLDAMVMDGPGVRVGSVGALYGVRNAIGVARAVMEHTRHSLLVGSGAKRFARMMGFEKKSTETSASTGQFLDWMDKRCQPNFYINMQGNAQQWSCGPYTPNQPSANSLEQILSIVATDLTVAEDKPEETRDVAVSGHDTIAAITLDAEGHLACATTTNGPGHKVAGRVGDSPIAGSGCYVEEGAGGAGATGDGDVMLRFLPSFHAVQLMKHGASPTEACEQALKKIGHVYPDFSGGMVCVNKQGEIGAASHNMNFQYTTATLGDEDPTVVHVPNLLSAMELLEAH